MNRENILKVADAIERATKPRARPKIGFNMGVWTDYASKTYPDLTGHNCKTVGCLGGWTNAVFPKIYGARIALGLTATQSEALFLPAGWNLGKIKPEQAVAVLRHLAKTGRVNWKVGTPS